MNKLPVSISPHLHSGRSSRGIMQDVIIALIPAVIASTIIFGFRALILIIVTVAACVISEYVTRKILKRPDSIHNLTAVVTGNLTGLESAGDLAILDGYFRWCDRDCDREGIFRWCRSKLRESGDHCADYFNDVLCFPNEYLATAAELLYVPTRRHFIGDLFFSLSDRSEDSLVIGYVFGYTRGKSR